MEPPLNLLTARALVMELNNDLYRDLPRYTAGMRSVLSNLNVAIVLSSAERSLGMVLKLVCGPVLSQVLDPAHVWTTSEHVICFQEWENHYLLLLDCLQDFPPALPRTPGKDPSRRSRKSRHLARKNSK